MREELSKQGLGRGEYRDRCDWELSVLCTGSSTVECYAVSCSRANFATKLADGHVVLGD